MPEPLATPAPHTPVIRMRDEPADGPIWYRRPPPLTEAERRERLALMVYALRAAIEERPAA